MAISVEEYKSLQTNQRYGCSVCEFCGEIACYVSVFDAELGHGCDEQNKAWRNPSKFVEVDEEGIQCRGCGDLIQGRAAIKGLCKNCAKDTYYDDE